MENQAIHCTGNRAGKEYPWQQGGKDEYGVGNSARCNGRDSSEDDRVYAHQCEGLKGGPGPAKSRLFVAHAEAKQTQRVKQIGILDQCAQAGGDGAYGKGRRTNDFDGAGRSARQTG